MATKKNGNGTALTSLFENIEEKGFGDVGAEDLKTPRVSIVQAMSPQRQKPVRTMLQTQRKEISSFQVTMLV
jgi:hypothetical protein